MATKKRGGMRSVTAWYPEDAVRWADRCAKKEGLRRSDVLRRSVIRDMLREVAPTEQELAEKRKAAGEVA